MKAEKAVGACRGKTEVNMKKLMNLHIFDEGASGAEGASGNAGEKSGRLPPVELRKQHEQHLQTFTENRDLVKSRLQRQSQILRQSRRHSSLM